MPTKNKKPTTKNQGRKSTSTKTPTTRTPKRDNQNDRALEQGIINAVDRVQATIEFELDGTIITANKNFLETTGYTLEEIQGKHHRMFVDPRFASSVEYREFWNKLARGEFDAGEYQRFGRNGTEIWLNASYNPILSEDGQVLRVVKFATDITESKSKNADYQGQLAAISKSQAVIEFDLDGNILTANDNFCQTLGYALSEIQGKHHRKFCDSTFASSPEYQAFWSNLRRGEFQAGEYKRIGKGGKEVWIQASYNPILDLNGRPFKVVKYATDVTASKLQNADFEGQLSAIRKSQAVIEFSLDGIVLTANENFCATVGYALSEIQGKHHRLFCEPSLSSSPEYQRFWDQLRKGEFQSGQYKRLSKGGKEIWIQASYNPILDLNGKPYKIVKYASDISAQKEMEFEIAERQKRDARTAKEQQEKVAAILTCVNAVADGDFTVEVPDLGSDAIGQVASALRSATDSIKNALLEVSSVSGTVALAAEQLSGASREISSGAQTQASSLEETASSLEEITSTVKQNSDNAQQARQLAIGSRDVAEKGGAVVSDAVSAMAEINQSSKKIADIITTIDEIAFQTNLLALNAAVEAARAGEQGRGFAVVAAEVRNLAQRSASAAKEIKTLIQDSVNRVENGTQLVNKSGETLSEIVNSVKRVTDIVSEIAAASKEQLTGIEQVNKAVAQMDRVTQANASQTEEVSGTASSLLSHAEQLRDEVAKFRLGDSAKRSSSKEKVSSTPVRLASRASSGNFSFAPGRASSDLEFERTGDSASKLLEF